MRGYYTYTYVQVKFSLGLIFFFLHNFMKKRVNIDRFSHPTNSPLVFFCITLRYNLNGRYKKCLFEYKIVVRINISILYVSIQHNVRAFEVDKKRKFNLLF